MLPSIFLRHHTANSVKDAYHPQFCPYDLDYWSSIYPAKMALVLEVAVETICTELCIICIFHRIYSVVEQKSWGQHIFTHVLIPRSNMYGRKRPDPMHFPQHSGEMAGNHRKLRGKWKQYSRRKLTGILRSVSRQIQTETRWKAAGKNPTISKQETCPQKKLDTTVSGRKTDSCSAPFSAVISLAFRW
jgi:hypothetical protein